MHFLETEDKDHSNRNPQSAKCRKMHAISNLQASYIEFTQHTKRHDNIATMYEVTLYI